MKQLISCIAALLLFGCSTETPWELSSIPAGEKAFDSARLCYAPEDPLSGMSLELYYSNGNVVGYLSSSSRRFTQKTAEIRFGSETITVSLDIHEGQMRAHLPDQCTVRAIRALQEGQSVSIMIGSQAQVFRPERFATLYHQLTQGSSGILESFQGHLP